MWLIVIEYQIEIFQCLDVLFNEADELADLGCFRRSCHTTNTSPVQKGNDSGSAI